MKKVWIDAGHGGKDPGATANGLQEKDIALTVSLAIKERLEALYEGVQVLLSRSSDVYLTLQERTDKANAAKADILLSIHCNAGGGAGGFETFRYTNASKSSLALQDDLHTEIIKALPSGIINRGMKSKNLHMVRESKMPAVLTENLFIDVLNDANKLKQQAVIDAIIQGHVSGIAKYLGLKKKEEQTVDKAKVYVNDQKIEDGFILEGRVYVPLRAAGEALDAKRIEWDNKTKTARLYK